MLKFKKKKFRRQRVNFTTLAISARSNDNKFPRLQPFFTVQYHVYILGQYRILLDRYNDPQRPGYYQTAEIHEESRGSVRAGNPLTHLVITSIQHLLKEYHVP